MIESGFEIFDPITKTQTVVLKGAREMGGRGWVLEIRCPEGALPNIPEHLHRGWAETFEILEGAAAYKVAGEERRAQTGDRFTLPPAVPHVHPWNSGSGGMTYRQTDDFGGVSWDAVGDVLGTFATIAGLAAQGKVGKNGLPSDPLQLAATLRTLVKHGGFDAATPILVQRAMGATLGRLAEALGYRGADPRYWKT